MWNCPPSLKLLLRNHEIVYGAVYLKQWALSLKMKCIILLSRHMHCLCGKSFYFMPLELSLWFPLPSGIFTVPGAIPTHNNCISTFSPSGHLPPRRLLCEITVGVRRNDKYQRNRNCIGEGGCVTASLHTGVLLWIKMG